MKLGDWSVDFNITFKGEKVSYWQLDENCRQQIVKSIMDREHFGELYEEDDEDNILNQ